MPIGLYLLNLWKMAYRKINFDTERKGVYIILDMRTFTAPDLRKLEHLLSNQVIAVQLWDSNKLPNHNILESIIEIVHQHHIPILINNKYELMRDYDIDGVHFDDIPSNWEVLKSQLKHKIIGVTCTNDMDVVQWATDQQIDYLSFCSMFPSENNTRCVLVDRALIKNVQQHYTIPFFLTGGIKPQHINLLEEINYAGIAIVSGLMSAENPKEVINAYYQALNKKP